MGVVDHEGQSALAVSAVEIDHPLKTRFHRHQNRGGSGESHLEHVADVKPQIDGPVLDIEQIIFEIDDITVVVKHPHTNQIEKVESFKGKITTQDIA